jgi:hypothetical protein
MFFSSPPSFDNPWDEEGPLSQDFPRGGGDEKFICCGGEECTYHIHTLVDDEGTPSDGFGPELEQQAEGEDDDEDENDNEKGDDYE